MKVTYDEFLAVLQSDDGKEELESKITEQTKKRFKSRFRGIYKDYTDPDIESERKQKQELDNMSPESFESNRIYQMAQLYSAYGEVTHGTMWIQPRETTEDAVRRVVGKHARSVYNTDILYLDADTIETVQAIAEFSKYNSGHYNNNWGHMSGRKLKEIVDELIACREIVNEERMNKNGYITMTQIVRETNAAKRAIGKQNKRNIFGIDDYSLTAREMISRKSNLLKKAFFGIKNAITSEKNKNKLGSKFINEDIER